jgi:dethiobiotin synthetase
VTPAPSKGARRIFVTGTDTGVGKTTVSCALVAALRARGRSIGVLKPIETGCADGAAGLVPADALRLAEAAGRHDGPIDEICPQRYALPASPEAAADAAGRPVDVDAICFAADTAASRCDLLFIEGAGGLLVPIADGLDMAGLAKRLGATSLLIVARTSLGTINHTRLTVEAAQARGLEVLGVVLSQAIATTGPDEASNAAAIERHAGVHVLGTLGHAPDLSIPALATLAEKSDLAEAVWRAL